MNFHASCAVHEIFYSANYGSSILALSASTVAHATCLMDLFGQSVILNAGGKKISISAAACGGRAMIWYGSIVVLGFLFVCAW